MAAICGIGIGADVCRALGIDAAKVRTIELRFAPDEIVTAKVVRLVHDTEAKQLLKVLEQYEMHKAEEHTIEITDLTTGVSEHIPVGEAV